MNKVILIGRIVRDPTNKTTQSGVKYSRFTIAVDRSFSENQTDFVPIVAWKQQASFIENYLEKGDLVSIEGRFNSYSYTNNEDQKVTRYDVNAERVDPLETKSQKEWRKNHYSVDQDSKIDSVEIKNKNFFNSKEYENDFKKEDDMKKESENLNDVPWELDDL